MDHLRPKTSMALEIIGSLRHNPAIQEVLWFDFIFERLFRRHVKAPFCPRRQHAQVMLAWWTSYSRQFKDNEP